MTTTTTRKPSFATDLLFALKVYARNRAAACLRRGLANYASNWDALAAHIAGLLEQRGVLLRRFTPAMERAVCKRVGKRCKGADPYRAYLKAYGAAILALPVVGE